MPQYTELVKLGFTPPSYPFPAPYDQTPIEDFVEFPAQHITCINPAKLVDDSLANGGKAAWMPGDKDGWYIQMRKFAATDIKGKWRVLADVRCNVIDPAGSGLKFAIYRNNGQTIAATDAKAAVFTDGKYHLLDMGIADCAEVGDGQNCYFVANPNSGLKDIYVNRIFFIRDSE
jgi:hypothetical protein